MIYLGADKHGFRAIQAVTNYLDSHQLAFNIIGVKDTNSDIKLEDLLPPIARAVKKDAANQAIISCGTGIGVEVGINKFSGIRACLADDPELAAWARQYDNCNVLCLVGWRPDAAKIHHILDNWFNTAYDGNRGRLAMFKAYDTWK